MVTRVSKCMQRGLWVIKGARKGVGDWGGPPMWHRRQVTAGSAGLAPENGGRNVDVPKVGSWRPKHGEESQNICNKVNISLIIMHCHALRPLTECTQPLRKDTLSPAVFCLTTLSSTKVF